MNIRDKINELKDFADRYLRLSRPQLAVIAFLSLLIVVGSTVLFLRSEPAEIVSDQPVRSTKTTAAVPVKLTVHVAGAVNLPGLYELKDGSRIDDAVKSAGGAKPEADLDSINLAAKISDGQKISVPVKGTIPVSANIGQPSETALNSATAEQLDQLDGIGPVLAKRIIDYRTKHGSFSSLSQLRDVEGIGTKKYARLKGQLTLN